jgi:hypothetical protein
MNQLIKLTKSAEGADPVWVNPSRIVWTEVTLRKKDSVTLTVIQDSQNDPKIIVTETPDQISEQMLKVREIKIVL